MKVVAVMMRTDRDQTGITYEVWLRTDEDKRDNVYEVFRRRLQFGTSAFARHAQIAARAQEQAAELAASGIGKPWDETMRALSREER